MCAAAPKARRGMARPTASSEGARRQRGFTYLGVLFAVALAGVALAAVGRMWQTEALREKEKQLLFVGDQYRRAIESYYQSTPGGANQYPQRLEDLLHDRRYPTIKRHLRRLYPDPVTGSTNWGLVLQQQRIVGVHSTAQAAPLKRAGFPERYVAFEKADTYAGWVFRAADPKPPGAPGAAPVTPAAGGGPAPTQGPSGPLPGEGGDGQPLSGRPF